MPPPIDSPDGFFVPDVRLTGRAAIVTGSSRGIGRATAIELAREGCDVVLNCSRSRDSAEEVKAQIEQLGRKAVIVQCDVSDPGQHQKLIGAAEDAFGRLDILVNNAAALAVADVLEESVEGFDAILRSNLRAPHFLTQRVTNHMLARGTPGCVVYMLSINATLASDNRPSYCISKAGLAMSMRLFAGRLVDHGIKVNGVEIAVTDTDFVRVRIPDYVDAAKKGYITMPRPAVPRDMAIAAISAIRLFDTGAIIPASGGIMMPLLNLRRMAGLESHKPKP
ncbi:MAG: SDR family NAD(P)-dependent oxidoreductase [Hyphomicrobiaceae bacterium]|nr:SDR family NAD(P)-dependent oxidoreductase [Hyphomicrobiaceae bacterium]